ncbi:conserved hypothetical protein [Microsporum canis CBS 113480]|uniref:C2H2-type domain-containing protein n=1 Tax=Arthroderma otae (strain ATCC MYA-4605 / CBS 113480) TaxID=554155 RepID=C5FRN7_ARTOC|nr:conserved hypothetical protein [Microsporum canis CBS 113480]EEQ32540.1 conserved hypothetical protein [Microsporum canis CBS 113480]
MASDTAYKTHVCKGNTIICPECHLGFSGWPSLRWHIRYKHSVDEDVQSQEMTKVATKETPLDGDWVGTSNILGHHASSDHFSSVQDGPSDASAWTTTARNIVRPVVGNLLDLDDDEMNDAGGQTKIATDNFKAFVIRRRPAQALLDTKPSRALPEKRGSRRCSTSESMSASSLTQSSGREHLCSPASLTSTPTTGHRIICFQCEAGFDTIIGLQHHQMMEGHNYCSLCCAYFADERFLDKHMKMAHNFRCPTCDIALSSPSELLSHQEETEHSFCGTCCCYFQAESIQRKHNRMYHMRMSCPTCQEVFPTQQELEQHQRATQHSYCGQCDEVLGSQANFEAHVATSHIHKCTARGCLFAAAKLKILKDHQERERHNFCSPCNRAFADALALANHTKSEKHLKRARIEQGEGSQT